MRSRRQLLALTSNLASYGTSGVIALLLTPYLVSTLGTEAYGFYPLANNFILYISIVGVALNAMAARFVMVAVIQKGIAEGNRFASSIFWGSLATCLCITPVLLLIAFNVDAFLSTPADLVADVKLLFLLLFLAMLVRIATGVFSVGLFVADRLEFRAYVEFLSVGIRAVGYPVAFANFEPALYYIGAITLVVEVASATCFWMISRRLVPDLRFARGGLQLNYLKPVLTASIWSSVSQAGAIMISSVALLVANVNLGATAAGNLAVALTIPAFMTGLVATVGSVFMPSITSAYAGTEKEQTVHVVRRAQAVSSAFCVSVVCVYVGFSPDFFALWIPGTDTPLLAATSSIATIHLVFTAATWPVSNLNVAMNRVKVPALAMLVAGAFSLAATVVIARHTDWGILGIAAASLVPNLALVMLFVPLYASRSLGVGRATFYAAPARAAICSVTVVACCFAVRSAVDTDRWLPFLVSAVVSLGIAVVVSALFMLGPRAVRAAGAGLRR